MRMSILPRGIHSIISTFKQSGFQCYLVGGALRDYYLNRELTDFDIATNAKPEEVMRLFPRCIPTGLAHGTVTVLSYSSKVEITTFRAESNYSDCRHPDAITYLDTITEDLSRRDFTINALAYDLLHQKLLDPFMGLADLKNKIIRAVGSPKKRFQEDALRCLRAIRFEAQLNFSIEKNTLEAIRESAPGIGRISSERIRDELQKILISNSVRKGLSQLEETGILRICIPELATARRVSVDTSLHANLLEHIFMVVSLADKDITNRLAALLYALSSSYSSHFDVRIEEETPVPSITQILRRLKFSNAIIEKTQHIITHFDFTIEPQWSNATVKVLLHKVGKENINDLIMLQIAELKCHKSKEQDIKQLYDLLAKAKCVLESGEPYRISDLCVKGNDLLAIGIKPGRSIGIMLHKLLAYVIADPSLNTPSRLLSTAKELHTKENEK